MSAENQQETDAQVVYGNYESLIQDVERIQKRHKISKRQINENVDKVIQNLEKIQQQIEDMPEKMEEEEEEQQINTLVNELHENLVKQKPLKNIFNNHREYFAYLSKVGKNIEKYFDKDLNQIFEANQYNPELIFKVIGEHFLHEKNKDISDLYEKEAKIQNNEDLKKQINLIQNINKSLSENDLQQAIEWANQNIEKLQEIQSDLLFDLHKLQFMQHVQNKEQDKAIQYARQYFLQFCQTHEKEINKLMSSIIFKNIESSPYADLYSQNTFDKVKEKFTYVSCKIYQIPSESALLMACTAGTLSLPSFLKLQNILGEAQKDLLSQGNSEIAIEFEHGKQFKYHNIFVCPVSREPIDPDQPPQLLKCGHVISSQSFDIITSNKTKIRFKCPTCQTQQKVVDSHTVYYN